MYEWVCVATNIQIGKSHGKRNCTSSGDIVLSVRQSI